MSVPDPKRSSRVAHLQLGQREAAAGPHAAVILGGRAAHGRPQLVDGAGRDLCNFGYPGLSAAQLAAGLFCGTSVNIGFH